VFTTAAPCPAVALLYIGGNGLLNGLLEVGPVYAMMRYTGVVETGFMAISEAVARFFATYGESAAAAAAAAAACSSSSMQHAEAARRVAVRVPAAVVGERASLSAWGRDVATPQSLPAGGSRRHQAHGAGSC
jgi:hypothetical protein